MSLPVNHPASTPETSGKGRRYCTHTSTMRHARLDLSSDKALSWCRQQLAVLDNPKDATSISLVVRRAVRLYQSHLQDIIGDPERFAWERSRVRDLSQLPGRPRKRTKTLLTVKGHA